MRRNRNCLFEDFDSSPKTARYFIFKAATFKSRNSSIARTTAGSMDTVLSRAVNHSSMHALLGRESKCGHRFWPDAPRTRSARIRRCPHRHCQRSVSTGRCPDLLLSRLSFLLDRDHLRRCLEPGRPIPEVDYDALIAERKNRHLGGLFWLMLG